jgi:hypothetical protein
MRLCGALKATPQCQVHAGNGWLPCSGVLIVGPSLNYSAEVLIVNARLSEDLNEMYAIAK